MPDSRFLFTVCQAGAEPVLKRELGRSYPELHFAFSRPGFVTFKHTPSTGEAGLDPGFELHSVFTRAYGLSLGKLAADPAQVVDLAKSLPTGGGKLRLHVWERDFHPPGKEPLGFEPGALARPVLEVIRRAPGSAGLFHNDPVARAGDVVFDVVVVEEGELWVGWHRHASPHSPYPGGRVEIVLPADAPSRAYLKLEEALVWSGAPLDAGQVAVEIGSAPGGASFALLQRGLEVVGIDPGEMDPRVLRNPKFRHVRKPVASVLRESLPETVHWLLLDMNVSPQVSLFAVDRLASRMKESLLGLLLTVKLNDWKMAAEIPGMLEHVRAMGMARVRATQLATNRQEIFVYGLTRKGAARAGNGG